MAIRESNVFFKCDIQSLDYTTVENQRFIQEQEKLSPKVKKL